MPVYHSISSYIGTSGVIAKTHVEVHASYSFQYFSLWADPEKNAGGHRSKAYLH